MLEYLGGCPACEKCDGYVKFAEIHYGLCDEHQCCWPIYYDYFISWRDETSDWQRWKRSADMLADFKTATPIYRSRVAAASSAESTETVDEVPF